MLNKDLFEVLNNGGLQLYLLIITFYALFADDFRIITSPKELDLLYDGITIVTIVSFFIEIMFSCFAKVGYIFSYYFWLDLISTLSLVLDIVLVKEFIIDIGQSGAIGFTKLGKVIRLIRLFRLIRISKLFKSISAGGNDDPSKPKKNKKDSKVGRVLSELATKRVILTVFLLLLFLPLFDASFWLKSPEGIGAACLQLSVMLNFSYPETASFDVIKYDSALVNAIPINQEQQMNYYLSQVMTEFSENTGNVLMVDFTDSSVTYYISANYSDYRKEEMLRETCTFSRGDVIIEQDNIVSTRYESVLNIIRTIFVSLLLLGGSLLFGRDIYNLVINPIERMIEKVTEVVERPQRTKEKAFIQQEEEMNRALKDKDIFWEDEDLLSKKKGQLETHIIESAIKKIGILLGIGLGEAGTDIIHSYLGKDNDADIIVPGSHTMAIFAFCDIRNFTDVTETLEEDIMVFVNRIASIVHSITDKYLGTANKNVGDAFLLVWKCPYSIKRSRKIDHIGDDEVLRTNIADLSLFAFLKIFAEINRAPSLKEYIENQKIQSRKGLGPDYKVRIGSGLHYGWAIEGAIGSYHKLDASYLSPNVNITMDLEGSTKEYGVPLLLSGEYYDCLSPYAKRYCRKIDCVYNSGKSDPLTIYTPNISDRVIKFPTLPPLRLISSPLKDSYSFKKLLKREILGPSPIGPPLFENDPDIPLLTAFNNEEFLGEFNLAYIAFEQGRWDMARDVLEKAKKIKNNDGPSKNIYEYMRSHMFEKPEGWNGVKL